MDKSQKKELISFMRDVVSDAASVVVVNYKGLTVAEMTDLRAKMSEVGASFKVTKNRLTRLALKETDYEGIADLFTGPTAIGYSSDPVASAKVLAKYAKDNEKLEILGGGMGSLVLDIDGIKSLAALPSLDELRGKLVGLLQAPATKIAGVTQAPAGQLARVFGAYGNQDAA